MPLTTLDFHYYLLTDTPMATFWEYVKANEDKPIVLKSAYNNKYLSMWGDLNDMKIKAAKTTDELDDFCHLHFHQETLNGVTIQTSTNAPSNGGTEYPPRYLKM